MSLKTRCGVKRSEGHNCHLKLSCCWVYFFIYFFFVGCCILITIYADIYTEITIAERYDCLFYFNFVCQFEFLFYQSKELLKNLDVLQVNRRNTGSLTGRSWSCSTSISTLTPAEAAVQGQEGTVLNIYLGALFCKVRDLFIQFELGIIRRACRGRETDRQTDRVRERERETDRQTD